LGGGIPGSGVLAGGMPGSGVLGGGMPGSGVLGGGMPGSGVLSGGIPSSGIMGGGMPGSGTLGYGSTGALATTTQLLMPSGVAVDSAGNLYISDTGNHRILMATTTGMILTMAGNGGSMPGSGMMGGGMPSGGILGGGMSGGGMMGGGMPGGAMIGGGMPGGGMIGGGMPGGGMIGGGMPGGGMIGGGMMGGGMIGGGMPGGRPGYSGDGGLATQAQLSSPLGVAVDSAGNLYFADNGNNRIRKVTPSGIISTVAGGGSFGSSSDEGPANAAQLTNPEGVAIDSAGNLYIADLRINRIRKVTPAGIISTVAGNGAPGFSGDGGLATASKLNNPLGVAVDSSGNLYIADSENHRIRKVTR
jgi:trimeric autotransporter adhesin